MQYKNTQTIALVAHTVLLHFKTVRKKTVRLNELWCSGPDCIKQLRLIPFAVFLRVLLHTTMDKLAEIRLKSMGNNAVAKKSLGTKRTKSHEIQLALCNRALIVTPGIALFICSSHA